MQRVAGVFSHAQFLKDELANRCFQPLSHLSTSFRAVFVASHFLLRSVSYAGQAATFPFHCAVSSWQATSCFVPRHFLLATSVLYVNAAACFK